LSKDKKGGVSSKTPVFCSELKDHFAGTDHPIEHQQNIPELLKAILQRNPNAFKGARTQGRF
jgi:hypothetical protein